MNAKNPFNATMQSYEIGYKEFIKKTSSLKNFPNVERDLKQFSNMLLGKNILDAGFGSGRDTLYFLERGFSVDGVELCRNLFSEFQKKTKKLKTNIYNADIRNFMNQKKYDGIWCCATVLHLNSEDIKKVLKNFYSMLEDKGVLYISMKLGEGEKWNSGGHISRPRYYFFYNQEKISKLIQSQKFKIVHEHSDSKWLSLYCKINIL